MNGIKYVFLLLVVLFTSFSCINNSQPEAKTVEIASTPESKKILNPDAVYTNASFEIEGMKCAMGCAKVIEKNINQMDGVKEVKVDFESKTATVSFDEQLASPEKITEAVLSTSDTYSVTSWNGTQLLEQVDDKKE